MEDQLPTLLGKLIDSSPWIGGVVVLTVLWRNEIAAFFIKLLPADDIAKTLGLMASKQDRMIELLEDVIDNSHNNGTSLAVLTALVQKL